MKFGTLLVFAWTILFAIGIYWIDNPFHIQADPILIKALTILIGAVLYIFIVMILLVISRLIWRISRIKYLREDGISSREHIKNPRFLYDEAGYDLIIDRKMEKIVFFNMNHMYIYDLSEIDDFETFIEKTQISRLRRLIYFHFMLGFKGVVVVRMRVHNLKMAKRILKSLNNIIKDDKIKEAELDLKESLASGREEEDPFEVEEAEVVEIKQEKISEAEKEAKRLKDAEKKRLVEIEKMKMYEADRQRLIKMEEERLYSEAASHTDSVSAMAAVNADKNTQYYAPIDLDLPMEDDLDSLPPISSPPRRPSG